MIPFKDTGKQSSVFWKRKNGKQIIKNSTKAVLGATVRDITLTIWV